MIDLVSPQMTGLFALGGSAMKLLSGFAAAKETREAAKHKRRLAEALSAREDVSAFQGLFAEGGMSSASAVTRRWVAFMLTAMIAFVGVYSAMSPSVELATYIAPATTEGSSYLFGLVKRAARPTQVVYVLTLGHICIQCVNIGAMAVAFYLTPAGKK